MADPISHYALQYDPTQGPQAQLAFDRLQKEIIHAAANLGYNALAEAILFPEKGDNLKGTVCNGYFSPCTEEEAKDLADLIAGKNGERIDYACIESVPLNGTKK